MEKSAFQFGLKAMFAATTGFALFFAALNYAPDHIYGLCFFALAVIAIVFAPDA